MPGFLGKGGVAVREMTLEQSNELFRLTDHMVMQLQVWRVSRAGGK